MPWFADIAALDYMLVGARVVSCTEVWARSTVAGATARIVCLQVDSTWIGKVSALQVSATSSRTWR
jgi:hypothetical protein